MQLEICAAVRLSAHDSKISTTRILEVCVHFKLEYAASSGLFLSTDLCASFPWLSGFALPSK